MGCDYLGKCIPGKNMLQAAKKIVLQEGSQPRRKSEEMKLVRGDGEPVHVGPESHFKDFGFINSE